MELSKKYILVMALFVLLFFSGCSSLDLENLDLSNVSEEDINKVIVCKSPYIRHSTGCCLDEDSNGICDDDDRKKLEKEINLEDDAESNSNINDSNLKLGERNPDRVKRNQKFSFNNDEFNLLKNMEYYLSDVGMESLECLLIEENEFQVRTQCMSEQIMCLIKENEFITMIACEDLNTNTVCGMFENDFGFEKDCLRAVEKTNWKDKFWDEFGEGLRHNNVNFSEKRDYLKDKLDIEVKIFKDYSLVEMHMFGEEFEFELDETDAHKIKEIISDKYDLDFNLVIERTHFEWKDNYDERKNYNSDLKIKVKIYNSYSKIKLYLDGDEFEFEIDETEMHQIKEIISDEYDLDFNLVIERTHFEWEDDFEYHDEDYEFENENYEGSGYYWGEEHNECGVEEVVCASLDGLRINYFNKCEMYDDGAEYLYHGNCHVDNSFNRDHEINLCEGNGGIWNYEFFYCEFNEIELSVEENCYSSGGLWNSDLLSCDHLVLNETEEYYLEKDEIFCLDEGGEWINNGDEIYCFFDETEDHLINESNDYYDKDNLDHGYYNETDDDLTYEINNSTVN